MELIDLLKETHLFRGVKDTELKKIAEFGGLRNFTKGERVFEEDSSGNEFYVIVSGSVAINKNVAGGRKRNLNYLKKGDTFGEMTLFDSEPRSADAEALEDTEVLVIDIGKFRDLLKSNLVFAFVIQTRNIRLLCKRLRTTDDMLKEGVIWGFSMQS